MFSAIQLANNPNRFLSTVQIGNTTIGIFAGAFGDTESVGDIAFYLAGNR